MASYLYTNNNPRPIREYKMTITPHIVQIFWFKFFAIRYANYASDQGYITTMYKTDNWLLEGGRWAVTLGYK